MSLRTRGFEGMFAEILRLVRKLSRSNQAQCAVCLAVLVDAEWHVDPMGRPYGVCVGGHRNLLPSWAPGEHRDLEDGAGS